MDFARPFELRGKEGEPRAVLLLHGLCGTPYDLHLLGQHLQKRGYHCMAPLLTRNPQNAVELGQTRWPDWLARAEESLHALWQTITASAGRARLAVIGHSMGGLLALELGRRYAAEPSAAAQPWVGALCTMATPLWLKAPYGPIVRWLSRQPGLGRLPVPRRFGADLGERNTPPPPDRPWVPLECVNSLLDLMAQVRQGLGQVQQPALLCHGIKDRSVPYAVLSALASEIGTPPGRLRCLALPRSYHLLPLDVEREILFAAISDHLRTF